MKVLKIILVFAVLVCGIYVATHWTDIFHGSSAPVENTEYVAVEEKCDEIRAAWNQESDWNRELFRRQKNDLDQDVSLGRYEYADEPETVLNTIREESTNKLCNAILREFHSPSCDDRLVEKNYNGVSVLIEVFKMDNDERLARVRKIKSVYDRITAFVQSPHAIKATYDPESNSWTSFTTLSQNVVNTAASYRNNPVYKEELSKITRFVNGLADSHIRSVVNAQKKDFYMSLSDQIIDYFNTLAEQEENITLDNVERFNAALDRYCREASTYTYAEEITKAYLDFKKKYDRLTKEIKPN